MSSPIRNIVVATDFSDLAEAAAVRAASIARLDGAAVHLVHAISFPRVAAPYGMPIPVGIGEGLRQAAEERMEQARKGVEALGVVDATGSVRDASEPVEAIQEAVLRREADLVVLGTHGRSGLRHTFLGSVAERTIRSSAVPVLAVKGSVADAAEPLRRILVAIDFSEDSERALDATIGLATRLEAAVDVVHAIEFPLIRLPDVYAAAFGVDLEQRIRDVAGEQLRGVEREFARSGITPTLHGRAGAAPEVIVAVAKEIGCQLIVMGTRGNTGLSHAFLGSVAERTLREAPCSVMTVTAREPREDA